MRGKYYKIFINDLYNLVALNSESIDGDTLAIVKITKLQTEVWGHNSKLETHTVETHIYRLRKKISDIFGDNQFIKSSKFGYIIK